jgi:hypothetical protein
MLSKLFVANIIDSIIDCAYYKSIKNLKNLEATLHVKKKKNY